MCEKQNKIITVMHCFYILSHIETIAAKLLKAMLSQFQLGKISKEITGII